MKTMVKNKMKMGIVVALALMVSGFDFSKYSIPLKEILDGGPPKDGIPALYDPEFVSAREANFLQQQDRILGLEINGEAKAYPIKILNWHELVNDHVGGKAVLVSYCPLCGTGMAYNTVIEERGFYSEFPESFIIAMFFFMIRKRKAFGHSL